MQGFRFFSIFTFLFLSLFIQKTCDLSSILLADDTISTVEKKPLIQNSGFSKVITKQKTHKNFFVCSSFQQRAPAFEIKNEKILVVFSYLPKPSFDNPSRAPPVA
jgi:hypothetical protein